MKRIGFSLVFLIILGLLGRQIVVQVRSAGTDGRHQRGPSATPVSIEKVTRQTVQHVGRFTGSLLPVAKFIIAPKISGRLEKLRVNIGDEVTAGTIIAELEDDEYRQQTDQVNAELKVVLANLEEKRINLEAAARELERVKRLRAKQIASEAELEAAQTQYEAQQAGADVATAQVEQKKAVLRAAQIRLAYTRIELPSRDNGERWLVGERFVDEGALLAANSPIVSVLDINRLTAVIHVIERDYPKIQVGQSAKITTDAYPDRVFQGQVVRMAPELKESSREARVEIEIANHDLILKPGMFVRVAIELAASDNALVIPLGSVVKRDNRQGVFLADKEQRIARFVPVKLGIAGDEMVQVLEPDLEGDIITLGQHLLEDGGAIQFNDAQSNTTHDMKPDQATPRP